MEKVTCFEEREVQRKHNYQAENDVCKKKKTNKKQH